MTPGGADGAGSRVGELDEEMVYESRVGDAIMLGTSSWRVEDITHDRVIVTPAPGVPARMPFWKGEQVGRPLELGRAVGAFVREMAALSDEDARATGHGRGSRRVGRRQPARLPARAARGHPARAQRPGDPRRALPRRAGRLAARRALPVRFEGQRAVGARDRGPDAGTARGGVPRVRRRRRHRAAAARRARRLRVRGRAHGRGRAARPGRGRADRGRRAGWVVAVRVAVPRVRGPGRCCSPGGIRGGARRCGSSGRRRPSCWPWPGATSSSR